MITSRIVEIDGIHYKYTKSDTYWIRKVSTEELYLEAVDPVNSEEEYIETGVELDSEYSYIVRYDNAQLGD